MNWPSPPFLLRTERMLSATNPEPRPRPTGARFLMSRATPPMRIFAQRLIACEMGAQTPTEASPAAGFPVPAKLRPRLATLMGNGGFRALLSRAHALAGAEVAWLRAMEVNPDGSLTGWDDLHGRLGPAEFLEGRVELLAQLLGLLVAFIGPGLTTHLVAEIWPKILLSDLDLTLGGKNEKTK